MKKSSITLALLVVSALFLIGSISAQALIAGKIYDSSNNEVDSASVTVTCNSNILNTNSLSDGTYAVKFNVSECDENSSVQVSASKDGMGGTGSGIVRLCDNSSQQCSDTLISIVNVNIRSPTSSGGGGGGGRYYFCGNNICNTGENEFTCPKDCPLQQPLSTSTDNQEITETTQTQETPTPGFFAGITGAVIGALGTGGAMVVLIFVVLVIGGAVVILIARAKKE